MIDRIINYKRPRILMLSHLYPSSARKNPNSGVFIRNQLIEFSKLADIYLYVPVDIMPNFRLLFHKTGLLEKLHMLHDHWTRTIFKRLSSQERYLDPKYIRYFCFPPKNVFAPFGAFILFLRIFLEISLRRTKNIFDVVHGQTLIPDGLAAVLLGRCLGCPVLVTVRGSDIHSIRQNVFAQQSIKWTLQNATAITTVSRELKQRVTKLGLEDSKVTVIRNGVDVSFAEGACSKNVKLFHRIEKNATVFQYVGSLREVKDPFTLMAAFEKVHKMAIDSHLLLVGDGSLGSLMREHANRSSARGNIHFAGYVKHEKVGAYFRDSDFLCLSSLREGWPNVLFEAMSFGKPVISTEVGGAIECICSEDYGFLVPPRDPDAMADAMLRALRKKWDHEKIRKYAYENTWEKVAQKYLCIYEELRGKVGLEL